MDYLEKGSCEAAQKNAPRGQPGAWASGQGRRDLRVAGQALSNERCGRQEVRCLDSVSALDETS